jgi:hypothetical protein
VRLSIGCEVALASSAGEVQGRHLHVRAFAIFSSQHGFMLCTLVFLMPLACAELVQEGYKVIIFT